VDRNWRAFENQVTVRAYSNAGFAAANNWNSEEGKGRNKAFQDERRRSSESIFRQDNNLVDSQRLENNRGKFRHNIWGPIACEVSTKSQNSAAFLEQHVPNWTLKAFVVESKEDYDLLYNEVRSKMKIPINIVTVQNGQIQPIERMYSEQKMKILKKEHGIVGS
jgi:hypothetical protein